MPSTVIVTGGGDQGGGAGYGSILKDLLPIVAVGIAAWLLLPKLQDLLSTWTGSTSGTAYSAGTGSSTQAAAAANPASTPGTYVVPGVTSIPQQGTGISNLFVTTGQGTPVNLFPLGNVITTSRVLSTTEQQQVLANLAKNTAGITNAWWQPQTLTQTTQPGGINSGGSPQSNIPVGTKHCPCTPALRQNGTCGANDDWYYC